MKHDDDGRLVLLDGDTVVAEASPTTLEVPAPPAVGLEEAAAAVSGYAGFAWHAFPTCFGCGPDREEGDGLRLFPGPVARPDVVACPWRPDPQLADTDGIVGVEFVWAALDCPTAFACDLPRRPLVLARLSGRIDRGLQAAKPHVVIAWPLGHDGRKHHAACAICTPAGEVVARSSALWIEPKDPSVFRAAAGPPRGA